MINKQIYYYSEYAASNYGFKIAETVDGKKIKFTGFAAENMPFDYNWNDKVSVGIFNPEDLKLIENVAPKSNREKLDEHLQKINAGKSLDQIIEESYQKHLII